MKNMNKIPELLAPAGNLETFYSVINAGADAVYLGGELFGARAYANNFSTQELLLAIDYAHLWNKKVYLTVNTLVKNSELNDQLIQYIQPLYEAGLDAVIIQDLGVAKLLHLHFPNLDLHGSTQLSITSAQGANYVKELGFTRIVPAREISLTELKQMKDETTIEIEAFIHGAMCYCYSGQCLFSSLLGGRSGNRGRCTQPCRLPYEYLKSSDSVGAQESYLLSMKDMNTIELLPFIVETGIHSLKIEGRMKQKEYAAGVVSIYRKYLNSYDIDPAHYKVDPNDLQLLSDLGNRSGFSTGYYQDQNGKQMITLSSANYERNELPDTSNFPDPTKKQRAVNALIKLNLNQPMRLILTVDEQTIEVEGAIVEQAQKVPLTKEIIQEKIAQTGNSHYVFEPLSIQLDEDAFVPASALKQLKRESIEKLNQFFFSPFQRVKPLITEWENKIVTRQEDQISLSISVETREQLNLCLASGKANQIYLNSILVNANKPEIKQVISQYRNIQFFLELPRVFRKQSEAGYLQLLEEFIPSGLKGMVVSSLDALEFSKSYRQEGMKIIGNESLYLFNDASQQQLEQDMDFVTFPYELNKKELFSHDKGKGQMTVYGFLPLMTSAQCLQKTTAKCHKTSTCNESGYLVDRYQKQFLVKSYCLDCYNVIYNSQPICLIHQMNDLMKQGFTKFRLDFHDETKERIDVVLNLYQSAIDGRKIKAEDIPFEYTNGHYKRGVE